MKLMVLGAYGQLGRRVVELANQQHWQVVAVAHRAHAEINLNPATILIKDVRQLTRTAVAGFDAIVDATGGWQPKTAPIIYDGLAHVVQLLSDGQTRYLKVGGANTLYINRDHSQQLQALDSYYPAKYRYLCNVHNQALTLLRTYSNIPWTYVTPPVNFIRQGAATGHYHVDGEDFRPNLHGDDGHNDYISYADFALGIIEIIAQQRYLRQQITLVHGDLPITNK